MPSVPSAVFTDRRVAPALVRLGEAVAALGGRAWLVGGAVRDAWLGAASQEADVEVLGLAPARLAALLEARFGARVVGRDFPVLKLRGLPIDVSVPRDPEATRSSDFAAHAAPALAIDAALERRDFTCNAMAVDLLSGEWRDPWGGREDLREKVLCHTSGRFGEDPCRVLRGMQLVARFGLAPAPATVARCRELVADGIPRERVRGEWRKLLLRGLRVSAGLDFLRETGWLRGYPELAALVDCPQDPEWHPEGDVFVHTGHCLDAFARDRVGDDHEDWVVGLAVLCHDFGKPDTTRPRDGRITAHGHEALGGERCASFLARLGDERGLVDEVAPLVVNHLAPARLHRDGAGDAAVRRLARRVGRIDRLVRVARADHEGRPPRDEPFVAGAWLQERARRLAVDRAPPEALVRGRDLLARGYAPGPELGRWLARCYEAQLEGRFGSREEGIAWLEHRRGEAPDG